LQPVVDLDVAPRVQLDAGHVEADPGGVGRPPRRNQDVAAGDSPFTSCGPDAQAHLFSGSPLDVEYVGPEKDIDPFGAEDAADFFGNVRVLAGEKLRPVLDHGDAAAEAPVRLGELEADVAATEDDEVLGQPVEFEQFDVRHRAGIRQAGNRRDRGVGPQVEE